MKFPCNSIAAGTTRMASFMPFLQVQDFDGISIFCLAVMLKKHKVVRRREAPKTNIFATQAPPRLRFAKNAET